MAHIKIANVNSIRTHWQRKGERDLSKLCGGGGCGGWWVNQQPEYTFLHPQELGWIFASEKRIICIFVCCLLQSPSIHISSNSIFNNDT